MDCNYTHTLSMICGLHHCGQDTEPEVHTADSYVTPHNKHGHAEGSARTLKLKRVTTSFIRSVISIGVFV